MLSIRVFWLDWEIWNWINNNRREDGSIYDSESPATQHIHTDQPGYGHNKNWRLEKKWIKKISDKQARSTRVRQKYMPSYTARSPIVGEKKRCRLAHHDTVKGGWDGWMESCLCQPRWFLVGRRALEPVDRRFPAAKTLCVNWFLLCQLYLRQAT